jgi:hypothetical protein
MIWLACAILGGSVTCTALADAIPVWFLCAGESGAVTGDVLTRQEGGRIVLARKNKKKKKKKSNGSESQNNGTIVGQNSSRSNGTAGSQDGSWYNSTNSRGQDDYTGDGSGSDEEDTAETGKHEVTEDGTYTSKEEVALYIHLYGHLPDNYISKYDAQDLGWDSREGNLDEVAPGMSIGGDRFGNYEGQLPEKDGRKYRECDIDYEGGYRNAKRIIYSNDGLIYYTEDHYQTFEQLY